MSREDVLNSASKFAGIMRSVPLRTNPPGRVQISDTKKSARSLFPVKLTNTDAEDDKYFLRSKLIDPDTGLVPGVGQAIAPEDYFKYAARKEDENFWGAFRAWIFQNSDLSTPEAADYWFRTFPFIKDLKFKEIEREAELQKSLAKIAAAGPESVEDWVLLYMMNQGMVTPSNLPLHKLNTLGSTAPYKPGIFSPFNWVPASFQPVIDPTDPVNRPTSAGQNPYPISPYKVGAAATPGAGAVPFNADTQIALTANVRRPS